MLTEEPLLFCFAYNRYELEVHKEENVEVLIGTTFRHSIKHNCVVGSVGVEFQLRDLVRFCHAEDCTIFFMCLKRFLGIVSDDIPLNFLPTRLVSTAALLRRYSLGGVTIPTLVH
jgi:hypothetical protein